MRQAAAAIVFVEDRGAGGFVPPGDLVLEALDRFHRIEAKIFGVGAHKTDGIGPARQGIEAILLQRLKVILSDFQSFGGRGQIVAAAQAGGAQVLPHGLKRGIGLARDFAQMDAAAAEAAAFIQRQMGNLGHRPYEIAGWPPGI